MEIDLAGKASSLLGMMTEMPLVGLVAAEDIFRAGGPHPSRTVAVRYDPPRSKWLYEVFLEDTVRRRPSRIQTEYRLVAQYWKDIYAIAWQWLFLDRAWPNGLEKFKVTPRMLQWLSPGGHWQRIPLLLDASIPEQLLGFYRVPSGFTTASGPGGVAVEMIQTWKAMGWGLSHGTEKSSQVTS